MDIFEYIATNNTDQANNLCQQYGIQCNSINDVADGLCAIAESDPTGQDGAWDVMDLHPDKNMILELYGNAPCSNCNLDQMMVRTPTMFSPQPLPRSYCADGTPNTTTFTMPSTNTCLIVGAIVIFGLALILTQEKKAA